MLQGLDAAKKHLLKPEQLQEQTSEVKENERHNAISRQRHDLLTNEKKFVAEPQKTAHTSRKKGQSHEQTIDGEKEPFGRVRSPLEPQ